MNIMLLKISSIADANAAVWVATNLKDAELVCRLAGTNKTVWTKEDLKPLSKLATAGSGAHLHDDGRTISFYIPDHMCKVEASPEHQTLSLFMEAYVKWDARRDGGEDELHHAYQFARRNTTFEESEPPDYDKVPDGLETWSMDEVSECLNGLPASASDELWKLVSESEQAGTDKPLGGDGSDGTTEEPIVSSGEYGTDLAVGWPQLSLETRIAIYEAAERHF
jgi:hypothetical protein